MAAPPPVRVFVSYSWDSSEQKQRVLELSQRLRVDGIDAWIDRFTAFPEEGWPRWMANQLREARFVIVVATEKYLERFTGMASAATGLGATWEGAIITQDLYEAGSRNTKFLPVIFSDAAITCIPDPLRPSTHFRVDTEEGYDALYRHITGQPEIIPAPIGSVRQLAGSGGSTEELPSLPVPAIHNHGTPPLLDLHGRPNEALRALISEVKWTVGAVNLDEDLHFSSFYLRASSRQLLSEEYSEFGYSKIIATYHDFNERYYLPEHECTEVAERLVNRMLNDPDWFQKRILVEIKKRADALSSVFSQTDPGNTFAGLTDANILNLYRKHNKAHARLYEVARVPETLDRGVAYFTSYLRNYLITLLSPDTGPRHLARLFDALTFPEEQSKKLEEIQELFHIAKEIREDLGDSVLSGSSKRMILTLEPSLVRKIEEHKEKWSFWGYHGYGSRATYDITHYLDQIVDAEAKGSIAGLNPSEYRQALKQAEERRVRLFAEIGVDHKHQLLFRFYSRIGIAKLTRRFVQLRNFYFLDFLLRDIARRRGLAEGVIRSLLPEEIETLLRDKRKHVTDLQCKRCDYAVLAITEQQEAVLAGKEYSWVEIELEKSLRPESNTGRRLHGSPLCPGVARGRVKVVNRHDDASDAGFRKGDILVSQSADPELTDLMGLAAGILVETGGVTCHAAIICRELGKPGISNIPHLLENLQNDDYVIIDAFTGTVEVRKPQPLSYLKFASDISDAEAITFGNKAVALARLQRHGLNVPSFFAIPLAGLTFFATPQDARGAQKDHFIQEVKEAIEWLQGSMFIIRSSMRDEDSVHFATAGRYFSESNVDKEDLVATVLNMIQRYRTFDPIQQGSIIVQDMVLADYSGVCFTKDPMHASRDRMVIEVVPGGNELLTSGEVSPKAYFFDRANRVFDEANASSRWGQLLDGETLRQLADDCERIEELFGQPQDIEWTLKGEELWIVQSRTVEHQSGALIGKKIPSFDDGELRDISTICRAYRVPPNLKLHLLRVAAVGKLIVDGWKGPTIDEGRLIKALLLHDIGNIVKVEYRTHLELYPDELRHLKYWIAVQQNIRARFGERDLDATLNIAKDIGVDPAVLQLIEQKQFILNDETLESSNWERKIAAYSDQRVGPRCVLGLQGRLDEARIRYQNIETASVNSPRFETLLQCAFQIEKQIQEYSGSPVTEIDDQAVAPLVEHLRVQRFF